MNMTEMKCSLRFLGWVNKVKQRESIWRDSHNNNLTFADTQIILRLNYKIYRYPYIGTDLQEIMSKILDTVQEGQEPIKLKDNQIKSIITGH